MINAAVEGVGEGILGIVSKSKSPKVKIKGGLRTSDSEIELPDIDMNNLSVEEENEESFDTPDGTEDENFGRFVGATEPETKFTNEDGEVVSSRSYKVRTNISEEIIDRIYFSSETVKEKKKRKKKKRNIEFQNEGFPKSVFKLTWVTLTSKGELIIKSKSELLLPLFSNFGETNTKKNPDYFRDVIMFRVNFFDTKRFTFFVYVKCRKAESKNIEENMEEKRKEMLEKKPEGIDNELLDIMFEGSFNEDEKYYFLENIDYEKDGFFLIFRNFSNCLTFVNQLGEVEEKCRSQTIDPNTATSRFILLRGKIYKVSRVEKDIQRFKFWSFSKIRSSPLFSKFEIPSAAEKQIPDGREFQSRIQNIKDIQRELNITSLGKRIQILKIANNLKNPGETENSEIQVNEERIENEEEEEEDGDLKIPRTPTRSRRLSSSQHSKDVPTSPTIVLFQKLESFVPDEVHPNASKWNKSFLFSNSSRFQSCFFDLSRIKYKKDKDAEIAAEKERQREITAQRQQGVDDPQVVLRLRRPVKLIEELPVYLVISDMLHSPNWREVRKIISPLLLEFSPRYKKNFRNFGIFHSALIFGPIYLEWNNSSFIQPREIFSANALMCFRIGKISLRNHPKFFFNQQQQHLQKKHKKEINISFDDESEEQEQEDRPTKTTQVMNKNENNLLLISDLIYSWNRYLWFSRIRRKYDEVNCQDFFYDFCLTFNINNYLEDKKNSHINEYIQKTIIRNGIAKVWFKISPQFLKHFEVSKKVPADLKKRLKMQKIGVEFQSHQDLDEFVHVIGIIQHRNAFLDLQKKEEEELEGEGEDEEVEEKKMKKKEDYEYAGDWELLKAFDRGFWLRHLKKNTIQEYQPHKEVGCVFGTPEFAEYMYDFPNEHGAVRMKKR